MPILMSVLICERHCILLDCVVSSSSLYVYVAYICFTVFSICLLNVPFAVCVQPGTVCLYLFQ